MITENAKEKIRLLMTRAEYVQDSCLSILSRLDAGDDGLQNDICAHVLDGFVTTLEDVGVKLDEWSGINEEKEDANEHD